MRQAVLVAFVLSACGFQAKPGTGGGASDGSPDSPSSVADAPAMIDAPMLDAAIDAPMIDAPLVWTTVETLTVPCSTQSVTSTTILQAGVMYRLHAYGECVVNTSNSSRGDPEYYGYNVGQAYDVFQNIDNGIAIDDPSPGPTKLPSWGAFSGQHDYTAMWTGAGATISALYHDTNYSNNQGSLTLQIQALQ